MDTPQLLAALGGVALLVVLTLGLVALRRRRRERAGLRQRFGPEYERTVAAAGSQKAAVAELRERVRDREALLLSDLSDGECAELRRRMALSQYRFVEDPDDVMAEIARTVTDALRFRGYPIAEDRERALRLLAVDHPVEAQAMRAALTDDHGGDVRRMVPLFADLRRALRDVTGVTWTADDAAGAWLVGVRAPAEPPWPAANRTIALPEPVAVGAAAGPAGAGGPSHGAWASAGDTTGPDDGPADDADRGSADGLPPLPAPHPSQVARGPLPGPLDPLPGQPYPDPIAGRLPTADPELDGVARDAEPWRPDGTPPDMPVGEELGETPVQEGP